MHVSIMTVSVVIVFFFSSRRRHTRFDCDWSSDVCSSDLDIVLHGLKISPDLDIVTYTLAGIVDPAKGWGIRGETFHALKRLGGYGRANWVYFGDRGLATHLHRNALLEGGENLSGGAGSDCLVV